MGHWQRGEVIAMDRWGWEQLTPLPASVAAPSVSGSGQQGAQQVEPQPL
jgi:hypothetical protein